MTHLDSAHMGQMKVGHCHPERLVTQGTGCIGQTTEAWPWGSEQHGKGAVLFQGAREALAEEVRGEGLESRAI